jgi:CBS domain containing-hemolysin-like protein
VDEPLGFVHKKELLKEYWPATSPTWKPWPGRR